MQVLSLYRRISPAPLALLLRQETGLYAPSTSNRLQAVSLFLPSPLTTKATMSNFASSGSNEVHTSAATSSVRTESDAFGDIIVDDTRYWGAQTQRSLKNFPIGGTESRMPIEVIKGMRPAVCAVFCASGSSGFKWASTRALLCCRPVEVWHSGCAGVLFA